jgi:hypothetical protein
LLFCFAVFAVRIDPHRSILSDDVREKKMFLSARMSSNGRGISIAGFLSIRIITRSYSTMQKNQSSYEKLFEQAQKHNQGHLFGFWDKLDETQRNGLLMQIAELDFDRLDGMIQKNVISAEPFPMPKKIEPAFFYPAEPRSDKQRNEYQRAWEVGENALRAGKVCAFTVAGGAGNAADLPGSLQDDRVDISFIEQLVGCGQARRPGADDECRLLHGCVSCCE